MIVISLSLSGPALFCLSQVGVLEISVKMIGHRIRTSRTFRIKGDNPHAHESVAISRPPEFFSQFTVSSLFALSWEAILSSFKLTSFNRQQRQVEEDAVAQDDAISPLLSSTVINGRSLYRCGVFPLLFGCVCVP